ncbi:MAG: hypothetical protein WCW44_06320 [archaeon]|jgi:hypothetical protein
MQHFPLTEKLHTDVLEEKYGPIHAIVKKHTDKLRESLLVDAHGIARTYAATVFSTKFRGELKDVNDAIKQGKPIGQAFREKGFIIRKNVLDVFIVELPYWLKKEFSSGAEGYAKARLSEFYAKKGNSKPIIYGVVTEVYSPDFRKPVINDVDTSQISATTKALEKNGFSKENIWQRIGNENNYDDEIDSFFKAKNESKKEVEELRKKVISELEED